jgi:hypothetical protein
LTLKKRKKGGGRGRHTRLHNKTFNILHTNAGDLSGVRLNTNIIEINEEAGVESNALKDTE